MLALMLVLETKVLAHILILETQLLVLVGNLSTEVLDYYCGKSKTGTVRRSVISIP